MSEYTGLLERDELQDVISQSFLELLHSVERARARRQSLALQANPLEVAKTRPERRKRAKQARQRNRPKLLLTPMARRRQMIKDGEVKLTILDAMLDDDQSRILELWAICEELLQGNVKCASLETNGSALYVKSPISDQWIDLVQRHMRFRKALSANGHHLQLISAFVAIQNGEENALSAAQYGIRHFPRAKNKRHAFLNSIVQIAERLREWGY